MKKIILSLCVVVFLFSCKKSDTPAVSSANTLTFDSTFKNVVMTGSASGTKWQLNAVIDLPPVGGFTRTLAFNMKFLQRPTANASYSIVNTEAGVTANTAMLYINHVDYDPSPITNISSSYFLQSGSTGVVDVTMVGTKVSIKFNGLTLSGNRGGGDKPNVAGNLTEN